MLQRNIANINFKTFISKKSIIISFKLRFLLHSLSNKTKCYNILNIKAKCNILFTKIAKKN